MRGKAQSFEVDDPVIAGENERTMNRRYLFCVPFFLYRRDQKFTVCYDTTKHRTNALRFVSKREFCHWCEGDDEVGGGFGGLDLAAAFRFRNMKA
ncbi:hypothetical protein R1flu_000833 [Riccia fluitans]|uniref:Uncharacterized protein n=1 Tax=Riccia fluitans TaxID=41844 RepID=A0ABD1Y1R2_9MARC